VSWLDVAAAASPPLLVDDSYVPGQELCTQASAAYRNGSNPRLLTGTVLPVIGSNWPLQLNCSGHDSSGTAFVFAYERPLRFHFMDAGDILVDPRSPQLFSLRALHHGGTANFSVAIPDRIQLCGMRFSTQGACVGAPGTQLSNAIDAVLGP